MKDSDIIIKKRKADKYQVSSDIVMIDSSCHLTDGMLNCLHLSSERLEGQSLNLYDGTSSKVAILNSALPKGVVEKIKIALSASRFINDRFPPRIFLFKESGYLFWSTRFILSIPELDEIYYQPKYLKYKYLPKSNAVYCIAFRYKSDADVIIKLDSMIHQIDIPYDRAAFRIGEWMQNQIYIWNIDEVENKYGTSMKPIFRVGIRESSGMWYGPLWDNEVIISCLPIKNRFVDIMWPYAGNSKNVTEQGLSDTSPIYASEPLEIMTHVFAGDMGIIYDKDGSIYTFNAATIKYYYLQTYEMCRKESDIWQSNNIKLLMLDEFDDILLSKEPGFVINSDDDTESDIEYGKGNMMFHQVDESLVVSMMYYQSSYHGSVNTEMRFKLFHSPMFQANTSSSSFIADVPGAYIPVAMLQKINGTISVLSISLDCEFMNTYGCPLAVIEVPYRSHGNVRTNYLTNYDSFSDLGDSFFKAIASALNLEVHSQIKHSEKSDEEIMELLKDLNPVFIFRGKEEIFYLSAGAYCIVMYNDDHGPGYVVQHYDAGSKLVKTYQKNVRYIFGGEIEKSVHEILNETSKDEQKHHYLSMPSAGELADERLERAIAYYVPTALKMCRPAKVLYLSHGAYYSIKIHDCSIGYIAELYTADNTCIFRYNRTFITSQHNNSVVDCVIVNKEYIGSYGKINTTSVYQDCNFKENQNYTDILDFQYDNDPLEDIRYKRDIDSIIQEQHHSSFGGKDQHHDDKDYDLPIYDDIVHRTTKQQIDAFRVTNKRFMGDSNSAATSSNYQHLKAPVLLASLCWAKSINDPDIAVQTNVCTLWSTLIYAVSIILNKHHTKESNRLKRSPDPINSEFWKYMNSKYSITPEKLGSWSSNSSELFDDEDTIFASTEQNFDHKKELEEDVPSTSFFGNIWAQCIGIVNNVRGYLSIG